MDLDLRMQRTGAYAESKGFAFKSYFLDCIRRGQARGIEALLSGPDYIREMEALFGTDLALAQLSYMFVWSQAQRAAVEGGLAEDAAVRIYNSAFLQAQRLTTIRGFAELNIQALMAFANAVAGAEKDVSVSPLVRACRAYIREHVYEELSVNQIAEAMRFSRSHLAHVFKNETGKTLIEVIQEEKIREAARLIEFTPLSLTEIGQMLGFCSQSHFTRVFRKITGTTPSKHRLAYVAVADGRRGGELSVEI